MNEVPHNDDGKTISAAKVTETAEPVSFCWQPETQLGHLVVCTVTPMWLDQLREQPGALVCIDLQDIISLDTQGLSSLADMIETAYREKASRVSLNVSSTQVADTLRSMSFDLLCDITCNADSLPS